MCINYIWTPPPPPPTHTQREKHNTHTTHVCRFTSGSVLFPAEDAESDEDEEESAKRCRETAKAFKRANEHAVLSAKQSVSKLLDQEKVSLCSMKVSRLFLEFEVSPHSLKVPQMLPRGW
jgi:hypothetical protein